MKHQKNWSPAGGVLWKRENKDEAVVGPQTGGDLRIAVDDLPCLQPERAFSDDLPVASGLGFMERNSPTLIGAAYSPWLFWDGCTDSLWAQALSSLENSVEHGGDRTQYAHLIAAHYRQEYEALFGPLPPLDQPQRFPAHAGPLAAPEAVAGLELFLRKADCVRCHHGPLLTNHDFHNLGLADSSAPDRNHGRLGALELVQTSEFNCQSPYSDADPQDCRELPFLKTEGHELLDAFRSPTLRNISLTGPYMHDGRFITLAETLDFYNRAPKAIVS